MTDFNKAIRPYEHVALRAIGDVVRSADSERKIIELRFGAESATPDHDRTKRARQALIEATEAFYFTQRNAVNDAVVRGDVLDTDRSAYAAFLTETYA